MGIKLRKLLKEIDFDTDMEGYQPGDAEYHNQQPDKAKGIGKYNDVDWEPIYDMLCASTKRTERIYTNDFEEILSPEELEMLMSQDIIYYDNSGYVQFMDDEYLSNKPKFFKDVKEAYSIANQEYIPESTNVDPFERFTMKVHIPNTGSSPSVSYDGTIKRTQKGWMLYDKDNSPEENGPFNNIEDLMSYYDITKEDLTGDYVKNL